jgi:hypothetical protein
MTRSLILAACLIATLPASAAAATPSFEPATRLDVAGRPIAVAVGDFDGDGRKDLAAAYGDAPGAVSVWLGTGDPQNAFAHQSPDVAVGAAPRAIVVRDLNGDGRDDLAVANGGSASGDDDDVTILLGAPSGLVAAETVAARDTPNAIDAGDIDADGDVDLVVANIGPGTAAAPSRHVSVLSGNGQGHFDAAHIDVGCQVGGVAIADLVAGGGPELGVACVSPTGGQAVVRIFARDAGGGLSQVGADHPVCVDLVVELAAGNFDGRGTSDLTAVCLTRSFAVLGSDRGFAPLPGPNDTPANPEPRFPAFSPQGTNVSLLHVEVADVNSDGFDDVLATDVGRGYAIVADGGANSRFAPETAVQGERRVGTAFEIPGGVSDVTAADVNEDGKRDLVAAGDNGIAIRYATTPVPGVRTGAASGVGHDAATVGAVVNPSGTENANTTTYRFEYGRTAAYGQTTAALPTGGSLSGTAYVAVSGALGGLSPETEYHYRVVASNGNGTTYGRDRTFRTGATPPSAPQGGGTQPAIDATAPRLTVSALRTIKRANLLRRGVRATVVADEPSTLRFELVGTASRVRLARAGDVVLAERTLPRAAGRRSATLKLPQRFRRGLSRRFSLAIRVTATDAAGNRAVTTRRLRVR